ncbi:tyrosine-type recombinase/integrase [Aeromicrobium sp. PE09-221]|uniref:tyrosine-type recombinase/integrase n=1 Tax=Aeromicrobium sp. PE09-221 TaxID=1898043 RepID=UPI00191C7DE8|nr:tyrosine-type recombinase/integrase [Aeromicrobium sp. PE09-221]
MLSNGHGHKGLGALVALGYLLAGHHRLHHRFPSLKPKDLAAWVFGVGVAQHTLADVLTTLESWGVTAKHESTRQALYDALLCNRSPRLEDLTSDLLYELVQAAPPGRSRRLGLFRLSRVLAHRGIIPVPLIANNDMRGPTAATWETVPQPWRDYAQRWAKLSTREPASNRSMLSGILTAGRWAAEHHPEAVDPAAWTRDIAAEYVAATLQAKAGQWSSGLGRNRSREGQPLSASGKANRMDSVRGFFGDLIEWEWITPRFNPRQVLSLPISVRAQLGPNPRVIDDASWAKLMAAGLTLAEEDLKVYGTPAAHTAGKATTYYPIEMVRALVGVWLFGGCRIDEIRRLELECITWDQAVDETTGEPYRVCLLHVPANKTSRAFSKPVDPLVGELIETWQAVRGEQPDLMDRKTGRYRQHLFCVRGQLVSQTYLNDKLIPILCAKASIPEADSRGALTSHRARTTIATQLLNAREPLSIADLQQWLGHKHIASTRYYAEILQRVLSAAYKRADYFARNVRTIQVLIDREAILTGAAAGGEQPWKYYDLGDGYCGYDFFAKCPHRLACARCPFYVPKDSTRGQLLAVKDGIGQMLEQLTLTDDEREALEGDREALTALLDKLSDVPTPAGPTPQELGVEPAFIPISALTGPRPAPPTG